MSNFFSFSKLFFFLSRKHCFLTRTMQKSFFCLILRKKKTTGKWPFFNKNHRLTPLKNVEFFHFLKTLFFLSRKHSFLTRTMRKGPFRHILRKKNKTGQWPFFDQGLTPLKNVEFFPFTKTFFFLV